MEQGLEFDFHWAVLPYIVLALPVAFTSGILSGAPSEAPSPGQQAK